MELVSNWFGLFAPAGTPADVLNRLNREINAMLKSPDFIEALDKVGAEGVGGTAEEFSRTYRSEAETRLSIRNPIWPDTRSVITRPVPR